jgi:hypothetical protein
MLQDRHTSSNSSSNLKNSSSSSSDFIYKEANKHHWAKLQSKIRQRLMAEHISYIDDDEEMARRRVPPPLATFLAPPAFLETAADKEERQRQQKLIDEARKKREDKYEEYRDLFAKDFPKGTAAHYQFLSQSIVTDLEEGHREHHPAYNQCRDPLSRHEGAAAQQVRAQLPEECRRNQAQAEEPPWRL